MISINIKIKKLILTEFKIKVVLWIIQIVLEHFKEKGGRKMKGKNELM